MEGSALRQVRFLMRPPCGTGFSDGRKRLNVRNLPLKKHRICLYFHILRANALMEFAGMAGGSVRDCGRRKKPNPEKALPFSGVCDAGSGLCGKISARQPGERLGQSFDFGRQAAFVTSRFVFVVNAFVGDAVDHFHRFLEYCLGGSFVACFHGFQHFLNRCAESSTLAGVVGALFD